MAREATGVVYLWWPSRWMRSLARALIANNYIHGHSGHMGTATTIEPSKQFAFSLSRDSRNGWMWARAPRQKHSMP